MSKESSKRLKKIDHDLQILKSLVSFALIRIRKYPENKQELLYIVNSISLAAVELKDAIDLLTFTA